MSYVATDIGTIPATGFEWYVIFFEGIFANALQKEINENFLILGKSVGRDVLVVRGYDSKIFHDSAYEAFTHHQPEWVDKLEVPALMVTNTTPVKAMESPKHLKEAKVMLFPLEKIYRERGSITGFLGDLLTTLKDAEACEALEKLNKPTLEQKWGWLTKYFSMNPGFFGFGVKLDQVINELIKSGPRSFA